MAEVLAIGKSHTFKVRWGGWVARCSEIEK
jgi:hypothetical protein